MNAGGVMTRRLESLVDMLRCWNTRQRMLMAVAPMLEGTDEKVYIYSSEKAKIKSR